MAGIRFVYCSVCIKYYLRYLFSFLHVRVIKLKMELKPKMIPENRKSRRKLLKEILVSLSQMRIQTFSWIVCN